MAIKAIINNTEKEIEQIKNSNEQDIDYVYSRIGDTEVEGEPPISIKSIGGELANYRIYGNTVDGESVGGLVNDGEHAGEYRVLVTVSNGTDTLTTPIYLPEQIRKVGDEAEYIDYGEQKQHRVRVNLSEVNEFSNSITDTSNTLNIWVQQGKNNSFVYPSQSAIFVITEPTAITTSITITNANDSIRIKHNGSKRDIDIDIVRGLSPGAYSVSFNVLNYDHTTVGGVVINNIMVNKGSTAFPYEPYIENTELDVTLPALSTIKGINTLSVNTSIQPSNIYIKDSFDYKKVFTATRTIEDGLPLNYKSIEDSDSTLKNYRIYGNAVGGESVGDRTGNLFDMKKFAETAYQQNATVNYSGNSLIFTPTENDAYVNQVYSQLTIPVALRSSCINVQPLTTYTISMNAPYKCFISWINDSFDPVAEYTKIPNNQTSYTFTTPSNCTKLLIRLGKEVTNIGDTFTISNIMLNLGSTALPYEPYGESVGDLVTSGEHAGEYRVPVTVEGKNLLQNTATSQTKKGITFTVNTDGSITCSGIVTSGEYADLVISGVFLGDIDILENGNCVVSCGNGSNNAYLLVGNSEGEVGRARDAGINISANLTWAVLRIRQADPAITLYPMIRKADIEDDTYEPYHAPVTTNIYLPEPLKMVGDEAEYVDYQEQKQHFADGTSADVLLPTLPTLSGTNTLSVGTEVQPSAVEVKGKLKR